MSYFFPDNLVELYTPGRSNFNYWKFETINEDELKIFGLYEKYELKEYYGFRKHPPIHYISLSNNPILNF
jgi:hypothetical protein